MKKIFGYLMQQKKAVFLIFILLIVQAYCDLALPQYTSDIVDTGILTNGVESAVPDCIREEELKKIEAFVFDKDFDLLNKNFEKIAYEELSEKGQQSYKKKYPLITSESIFTWDGEKEDKSQLEPAFAKAIILVNSLAQDGTDVSAMIQMPKEQRKEIMQKFEQQMAQVDDTMLTQMAVRLVTSEYEMIGIDMEAIQNHYILIAGVKMILLSLLAILVTILVSYVAAKTSGKIGMNLRDRMFGKVISFSNAEMDRFSTASLITRSTNDIQQIQMVSVMLLRMVIYAPILGVGGILKVMKTNTSMSWIIGVAVACIILVVMILFSIALPKFKIMQTFVDKMNLVTREILTGIPVIRAFSAERHEEKRFESVNQDLTKTMLFTSRVMAAMMPIMLLLINCTTLTIVWFGAKSIDKGSLQIGEMMAFMTYAIQIVMSFLMITMVSIFLPRAGVAANRIDEVLKTEPIIKDPASPKNACSQKGTVEFKDVSFQYPGADGYTLEHISFTAKPGETTAFIGSTGSGKSTLVNLIPRFYDVTEGSVCVDGVDVREMSQRELRDKLGFVPQKAVLFSGTIASNIRYGKEDAEDSMVRMAARIAQSADFIEEKEEQYESAIAQGGNNVSGGQKQRLSIARAVAKCPEIFVFDDSFSALDFKTDVALRKALKKETSESTVLVVAQRISTILNAEQIIVLDEGRIVGKGTHEELLKNCEVYYEIATSQLSQEELGAFGVELESRKE